MLYDSYESVRFLTRPLVYFLEAYRDILNNDLNPLKNTALSRTLSTLAEMPYRVLKDYPKQAYGVTAKRNGKTYVLREKILSRLPFCDLIEFEVDGAADRPKVLIAAALSGHYATLLRDTVRGFARDFRPYITDWKNAREVPVSEGDFGFEDYVSYLIEFMKELGPGTHMVATCQAAPPAMVAAAILAERHPELVPATMTLMAGPMDTRINPGFINKLTEKVPLKLMRKVAIKTVPKGFPGAGRRVYPGFFQLSGFMSLNLMPHIKRHATFMGDGIKGNEDEARIFRDFYDEYFAVLDMTESFYVESLERVFFEHHIPRGLMTYQGEIVDFGAIHNMPLLTIEGDKDNMCPPGQTVAAHDLCPNIPDFKRGQYIQTGAGHYGVFSGSKFQKEIYPRVRNFMHRGRA
ncbi:MAG: polyhydroxyalkanoate depolymerase [Sphingomonadales bacterium]